LYLGSQIETQIAIVLETVLNQKRHFVGEADLDLSREPGCLAEVDEIF